jgi:uncharacterized protein (UPF0335 family)
MTAPKVARDHLKSFVERIERLAEEKATIADDIKSVYAEAKANGFDNAAIRAVVKLRKLDPDERKENEAILETYLHAIGMLDESPVHSAISAMSFDRAARDQVIEAFKQIVPDSGEVIVKMGAGAPVRLSRDSKGKPKVEEITVAEADDVRPGKKLGSRKKSADILKLVPKAEGEKENAEETEREPEPVE